MKKFFCFICLFLLISISGISQTLEDVIYFKNGSMVRGMIIEQIPDSTIKIKTRDGNIFVYYISDIEKITKEQISGSRNIDSYAGNDNVSSARKSPGVAFLLSFLVPGGGQLYNGEYRKAGCMLAVNIAGWAVAYYAAMTMPETRNFGTEPSPAEGLFVASILVVFTNGIWSMVDAPVHAREINRRLGLSLNYKLNNTMNLALKPDYKLNCFAGKINPVFGAKLSINIH